MLVGCDACSVKAAELLFRSMTSVYFLYGRCGARAGREMFLFLENVLTSEGRNIFLCFGGAPIARAPDVTSRAIRAAFRLICTLWLFMLTIL